MFEVWTGEKQFQRGVTSYLKHYAYKNARMGDFLDAIGTGQPRLSAAFQTFLNQPGVPEISVALKCDFRPPSVALSQKRYLPIGSKGPAAQTWQAFRFAYGTGEAAKASNRNVFSSTKRARISS